MGKRRTQVWKDVAECRAQAQEPPGIQNEGTMAGEGGSQYGALETVLDVSDFCLSSGEPLQNST